MDSAFLGEQSPAAEPRAGSPISWISPSLSPAQFAECGTVGGWGRGPSWPGRHRPGTPTLIGLADSRSCPPPRPREGLIGEGGYSRGSGSAVPREPSLLLLVFWEEGGDG